MLLIVAFLRPYLVRIILISSLIAALGGGFLYLKIHYEHVGYNKAIAAVAAKDERALHAVREAIALVDKCYSDGGTWDVVGGVCR